MDKKDLKFILQEGEGFKIEFKEGLGGIDKDLVAFANAGGGRIFLGIDDHNKAKGFSLTNKLRAQINDLAKNCDPPIEIGLKQADGVAIIDVAASEDKPHKCSNGFFLRKDATSQKMSRNELVDFIYDHGNKRFDSLACKKFNFKDLDRSRLAAYLKKAGIDTPASTETTLFNLGVYEKPWLNNAGILFFSKLPKRYFINAYITCARYLGTEKVDVLDRADFAGDLVSQVEEAIKFVKRNTRLSYKIKDIQREEIPEYPTEALREAIINAVMHRDYFETGAHVQVDIYDDRLSITNLGALIKPLTRKTLGELAVRRNPLIADLFHRIEYVEKMGTGLRRIKDACKKHGVRIKVKTNGFFIITFKPKTVSGVENVPINVPVNVPINVPINQRQSWLLETLTRAGQVKTKDFQRQFGNVALKTIKRDLAYLQSNSIIKFVGAPKTGYYILTKTKRGRGK